MGSISGTPSKLDAITEFHKWFAKKAGCDYDERHNFRQQPKGS